MYNFLTFDIEEWFHANYSDFDASAYDKTASNLDKDVDRLMGMCRNHSVVSTCFVLGSLAENKPHVVRKIHDAGHEIASHGYGHKLVYGMTPEEFKEDLRISCDILEQVTGEKVVGFRAPSWSVKEETLDWFYDILAEQGILYSSSVYPAHTYLYGIPGFRQEPHFPVINGKQKNVLEIPQSVAGFAGKYMGFAGGFYLRVLPYPIIKYLIRKKNENSKPVFIYLHPREIDVNQPRLELKKLDSFIHYYGIKQCYDKINKLTNCFSNSFVTMKQYTEMELI